MAAPAGVAEAVTGETRDPCRDRPSGARPADRPLAALQALAPALPALGAAGCWLADGIARYLDGEAGADTLDQALGLQGRASWAARERATTRDDLVRELAAPYREHPQREQARRVLRELERYRAGGRWAAGASSARIARSLRDGLLHQVLVLNGQRAPSLSTIRRALAHDGTDLVSQPPCFTDLRRPA